MSALVIDTSSWSRYFRGQGNPEIESALADGRVHVPPIVAAELLSAKLGPRQRRDLESLLLDLPFCDTDRQHWFRVGAMRSALFARGISVSTPDAHIAQCAIDLQARLLTEDAIFGSIARHQPLQLLK